LAFAKGQVRRVWVIVGVLIGAAALAAAARTAGSDAFTLRATVTSVVDGDTLHARVGGRDEKVRLIGIDAPEVGACDAAKATALARRLAQGRTLTLVSDPTQATHDRYGRLLAYAVLPDGRDVGYQELARGYARIYVYNRPFRRLAMYRRGEQVGRTRVDSIWRGCVATPPPPSGCDPSYPDVCIPPPPPDLDCADVPYKNFRVVGADPHRFDGDRDGIGCEE
jgi:micrococcal nuclease